MFYTGVHVDDFGTVSTCVSSIQVCGILNMNRRIWF